MSDLVGNHIVGFPTRQLICSYNKTYISGLIGLDELRQRVTKSRSKKSQEVSV